MGLKEARRSWLLFRVVDPRGEGGEWARKAQAKKPETLNTHDESGLGVGEKLISVNFNI